MVTAGRVVVAGAPGFAVVTVVGGGGAAVVGDAAAVVVDGEGALVVGTASGTVDVSATVVGAAVCTRPFFPCPPPPPHAPSSTSPIAIAARDAT